MAAAALAFLVGCAAATNAPMDASVDLTSGSCDPKTLFATCSAQCNMPVCIVASAMCVGTNYVCDCAQTGPCGADMRQAD